MTVTAGAERSYVDESVRMQWLTAIPASSAAGSRQLTGVPCLLAGWSSGAAAAYEAYLYAGSSSAGLLVAVIAGSQTAPGTLSLARPGLPVESGLYLDVNGATFDAVVYVQLFPGGF